MQAERWLSVEFILDIAVGQTNNAIEYRHLVVCDNYISFGGIVLAIYVSQWGLFKWLEKR